MYFHPGFAARNAVTAVELAERARYASENILEGEAGLFAAFRRAARRRTRSRCSRDGRPEILERLQQAGSGLQFRADAVPGGAARARAGWATDRCHRARIVVRVPSRAMRYPGCDFAGPFQRALQAKMSIQFGVAAALARGAIAEENYQRLDDAGSPAPDRADRARGRTRPSRRAFRARRAPRSSVSLADGSRSSSAWTTWCAATSDEVRARFRAAAAAVLGPTRAPPRSRIGSTAGMSDDVGALLQLADAEAPGWTRALTEEDVGTTVRTGSSTTGRLRDDDATMPMGVRLC